jgi:hypothetical protein
MIDTRQEDEIPLLHSNPFKSFGQEVSQDVRGGCLDSLILKSYVLRGRNLMGQRGLAVLALHGDNNVFNNCNIGDWLVRNLFDFKGQ